MLFRFPVPNKKTQVSVLWNKMMNLEDCEFQISWSVMTIPNVFSL